MILLEPPSKEELAYMAIMDGIGEPCKLTTKPPEWESGNPESILQVDFPDGFHVRMGIKESLLLEDSFIAYVIDTVKVEREKAKQAPCQPGQTGVE